MADQGRSVRLVLCTQGQVLGALPPFPVQVPWWPEVGEIIGAARERYGLDVSVLRLIGWPSDRRAGGEVSYLAELATPSELDAEILDALAPWPGDPLAPHRFRQPWAEPGGPAEAVQWAAARLADRGIAVTGTAEQIKSWNLSAIWRLPTSAGPMWLKCVPDFFAHEGAMIDAIGAPLAPRLIAFEPGRILMAEIDGEDHHEATGPVLPPMIELLTTEQARWLGRVDELLALGLPDRRLDSLLPRMAEVTDAYADQLGESDRRALADLIATLPRRIDALADCGIPDTLVHGDFHPGNVRGGAGRYVILDWGDSAVGHPLTDELAFTRRLDDADRAAAATRFAQAWQNLIPGCAPVRAVDLLRPVSPLIAAVQYADFLDAIEPDEHIYHAADPAEMLRQAASLAINL